MSVKKSKRPGFEDCVVVTGKAMNGFLYHCRLKFKIELVAPKGSNTFYWKPIDKTIAATAVFQGTSDRIAKMYKMVFDTIKEMGRDTHRKYTAAHPEKGKDRN
jgi:hypothetical protein